MKITALLENKTKNVSLFAEHGISFLVEADDKKILFDVGATDFFLKNAKKLAIDLDDIDCIVLSHGHYDHVGGLEYLKDKTVYVHPDIFIPKYDLEGKTYEYAGFPRDREYYEQVKGIRFIEIEETFLLTPNIQLHLNFKKLEPNSFCLKVDDNYVPDLFLDELALSVNTPSGLVVMTGCAHSGILNTLDKAILDQKNEKILALLGGFHLKELSHQDTKQIAKEIDNYNIQKIGMSHCTGDKLANYVTKAEVFSFNVGDVLNF